jgi:hypothetical protein
LEFETEVLLQSSVVWTRGGYVLVGFRVLYRKEDFLVLGVLNIFRKLKNNWVEFSKILDIKKKREKRKKLVLSHVDPLDSIL